MSGHIPTLRDYQSRAIEDMRSEMVRGNRRVIYCLPTGGGKTTVAAEMITRARAKGIRTLFLAHRKELVEQASARLDSFGVPHGVIMAGSKRNLPWETVQVASVQTIARRPMLACDKAFGFVYVDECHRTLAASYMKLLERLGQPRVVGLSATPYRTDGKGLGKFYDSIVMGPTIEELTARDFLVPVVIYSPPLDVMQDAKSTRGGDYKADEMEQRMNRAHLVGDIVTHWMDLAKDRPTVAFAVSIAHSLAIVKEFEAAGVKAAHIDGKMHTGKRTAILKGFAEGHIQLVSNCGVLTEGWDCPPTSCAIIARPTLSKGLWFQMAGRILRPAAGKRDAIILDHAGVALEHGHLYVPNVISLESKATKPGRGGGGGEATTPTRVCSNCFGIFFKAAGLTCPRCGHLNAVGSGKIETVEGTLEELKPEPPKMTHPNDAEPEREHATAKLIKQARKSGFQPGWVFYRLVDMYGKDEASRLYPQSRQDDDRRRIA